MSNLDLDTKQKILELESQMKNVMSILFFVKDVPLSDVAKELGISRQGLNYHLSANYKDGVDFYLQSGKIYIRVGILHLIKAHYGK